MRFYICLCLLDAEKQSQQIAMEEFDVIFRPLTQEAQQNPQIIATLGFLRQPSLASIFKQFIVDGNSGYP